MCATDENEFRIEDRWTGKSLWTSCFRVLAVPWRATKSTEPCGPESHCKLSQTIVTSNDT